MKIDITYEKKDILRLVRDDLQRRSIRVQEGTTPDYKGALQVKLSVDVEDTAPAEEAAPTKKKKAAPRNEDEVDDGGDITDVIAQSGKLKETTEPKFQRTLGPNESTEFPR